MSFDETIHAYFVTTSSTLNEATVKDFETAIKCLRSHIPEDHIRQIKASEGFPLIASGQLTKKDVFVFDKFAGDFFVQLQQTKSLIVGTRCLLSCLLKCEPIPLGTSPVFTTAMRNLQISASGISVQEKERLRELIQWMGGYYFNNLGRSVTHLISNTIKSTKYEHATLNGIPVMHVDWVQRVWERSSVDDVPATAEEFEKYRLPIFFGTNITCTGLETDKKNEIMRLVNENGGTYHSAFRSTCIDIVITAKDKTNSDKYKAAVRYKKDVLCPEWIIDSVGKGYALPTKAYQVKSMKVSTPTKSDRTLADFTHMSDISRISLARCSSSASNTVNDTIALALNDTQQQPDGTFIAPAPVAVVPSTKSKEAQLQRDILKKSSGATTTGMRYQQIYDEICPNQAKKAGNFLDGCCIYLSGFRAEEREKLNRILNVGGATRYDVVNEKITHIIVGQFDDAEYKNWKKDGLLNVVNIVRIDWLLQSIKLKQPASEVVYRMSLPNISDAPDAPSPSSKKTLRSMNHSFKQPDLPTKKKLFDSNSSVKESANTTNTESQTPHLLKPMASSTQLPFVDDEEEHNLIAQYSQENIPAVEVPQPIATSTMRISNVAPAVASCTPVAAVGITPVTAAASTHAAAAPLPTSSELTLTIDYENLDFFQGISLYIDKNHFPEEFYTQMISECEAAQGNVVASSFKDTVDYAIVSFERTLNESSLKIKARNIITELYVESCLKQNKLVPIEYFHRPIPHTADSQPLTDMTIVISIYTGLERDFIDSIAQLLGARVNKTFVKKEKPLLICPQAEGSKYEGAIKWGYPVVTSEWLVHCAAQGEKLSYQEYLVGDSASDFPISPALLRERSVTSNEQNQTPISCAAPAPEMEVPMDTAAVENNTDFTPLRNKRVSELAGPRSAPRNSIANAVQHITTESPQTPTNTGARPTYSFEYMEKFLSEVEDEGQRACLREIIDDMKNNQTPELERIRRQACTPINRKIPTPKGIPEFCTTPAFEKRMADAFQKRWGLPMKKLPPDTPIEVIRKRLLNHTCKQLGIPYDDDRDNDEDDGERPSTSAAKRVAKDPPSPLPAPTTAAAYTSNANVTPVPNRCSMLPRAILARNTPNDKNISNSSGNGRTSDAFVPGTQTPTNHAATTAFNSSKRQHDNVSPMGVLCKSSINFDKISFEDTTVGGASASTSAATVTKRSSVAAATSLTASPEIKQITDYLKNCETRRQSLKRSRGADELQNRPSSLELIGVGGGNEEAHYVQPFESEQFGMGTEEMVGWRDPVEFGKERRSKVVPSMQYKGTPRFSISCSDEQTRDDVIEKILQLNGTVCENLVNFDPDCTHFICERPNRGEKTLGCISSGKWVLSLKYIEECFAKDVFIDEELYEWGNSKALNLPQLSQDEQTIAQAAHRWRKDIAIAEASSSDSSSAAGAFKGFCVILRITERNKDALKNVIKAGGGRILNVTTPYSKCSEATLATHCFVDLKKTPLSKDDYEYLRSHGVSVYSQMYINSHLMYGSEGDFEKYEIKM